MPKLRFVVNVVCGWSKIVFFFRRRYFKGVNFTDTCPVHLAGKLTYNSYKFARSIRKKL